MVGDSSIHVKEYSFRVSNEPHTCRVNFVFSERYEKLEYDGDRYLGNPKVKVVFSDSGIECKEYELRALFRVTYNKLSYNATTSPELANCLFDNATNVLLIV